MTRDIEQLPNPEQFVPTPATEAAWQARSHMLRAADSEPGSVQADTAQHDASQSFTEMVRLTEDMVLGNLLGRTNGNQEVSWDIAQEVYLRAYKHLPKFRGDSQVETWLYRISLNQLGTYYTKESRHIGHAALGDTIDYDLPDESSDYQPEARVLHGELSQELTELIDGLSPKYGAVLRLRQLSGWTHEQIASHLGITVSASKVRLHRALQNLRERVPGQETEE